MYTNLYMEIAVKQADQQMLTKGEGGWLVSQMLNTAADNPDSG